MTVACSGYESQAPYYLAASSHTLVPSGIERRVSAKCDCLQRLLSGEWVNWILDSRYGNLPQMSPAVSCVNKDNPAVRCGGWTFSLASNVQRPWNAGANGSSLVGIEASFLSSGKGTTLAPCMLVEPSRARDAIAPHPDWTSEHGRHDSPVIILS